MNISDLKNYKKSEDPPLVVLTAYTAPMARIISPLVDLLLVGDSVGTALYGMPGTRGVTLDMMQAHGKAVCRVTEGTNVIIDMPFGSYDDPESALENAQFLLNDTGAGAVKLEGGISIAPVIETLTNADIPVIGHVGLQPQSEMEGFKAKGRNSEDAEKILADAVAVQKSGAIALVIEAVFEPLARKITEDVSIPTIGIGASPECDGQVLVSDDMLGLCGDFSPRFVKRYADLESHITSAVTCYANEVRDRLFPDDKHVYKKRQNTK